MSVALKVLLVGRGRMGQLVESLAPEYSVEVTGAVTTANAHDPSLWPAADVAIDFSAAEAVPANARHLLESLQQARAGQRDEHDLVP